MKKIVFSILIVLSMACLFGCGKKKSGIQLGQYKGLAYAKKDIEVTDDDMKALLSTVQSKLVTYEIDESRAETMIREGDTVNIDYSGILDGETTPFSGGTATGTHLDIGSGSFIEGFEAGLIGKKVGQTVILNLTFPERYHAQFAGKKVAFTVTINAIEKKIVPEITDELIKDYTKGVYSKVDDYVAYAREYVLKQRTSEYEETLKAELVKQVVANTKFEKLDQDKLDSYYEDVVNYYTAMAERSNLTLETYVTASYGKTMDEFYAEIKGVAEETMKEELVLNAIISKEGIKLTDDMYQSMITDYMTRYGYSTQAEFESAYSVEKIKQSMLFDLAMKLIVDTAVAM